MNIPDQSTILHINQSIDEPKELVVARGISLEAKDSTTGINKFVDVKIGNNVEEKGALKLGDKVYSFTKVVDLNNEF